MRQNTMARRLRHGLFTSSRHHRKTQNRRQNTKGDTVELGAAATASDTQLGGDVCETEASGSATTADDVIFPPVSESADRSAISVAYLLVMIISAN